jgi:hypothetical protein
MFSLCDIYFWNDTSIRLEVLKAAKATLERRGDQSTGWSMA